MRNTRKERRREKAQQKAEALNRIDLAEDEARKFINESGEFGDKEVFLDDINPRIRAMRTQLLHDHTSRLIGAADQKGVEEGNLTLIGSTGTGIVKGSVDDPQKVQQSMPIFAISEVSDNNPDMHQSMPVFNFHEKGTNTPLLLSSHKDKRHSLKLTKDDLETMPDLEQVIKAERIKEWASLFRRADPRYQIAAYFDEVAHMGMKFISGEGIEKNKISPILKMFYRSSVFTVWRPTSMESIKKMMKGQGVGKGLDIKGKSATSGVLSGFVPFLQLYEEKHKKMIRTLPKKATMRIFYKTEKLRNEAAEKLADVGDEMLQGWTEAQSHMTSMDDEALEAAMAKFMWEMDDPEIVILDEYAKEKSPVFGIEIPQRLFWEAYVMRNDTKREPGTPNDTGRPSEPAFQDMNFATLRNPPCEGQPRPVVYQCSLEHALCPLNLVMAYEQHDKVSPVVSDFDCFLVGTRGVAYESPISESQIGLVKWCIKRIDEILGSPQAPSWTARWLNVLKESTIKPNMPLYGFGDPKSYWLMEQAIDRLSKDGCVRHGAECFNYYFPQELDDHFLVINDMRHDKGSLWKYVSVEGLQEILLQKVTEGYTFPLNPKWILCDPGWKAIYDEMMTSEATHVQNSLNCWYPPESGIREMIEEVYAKSPHGFVRYVSIGAASDSTRMAALSGLEELDENDGTAAMDLAEQELRHYEVFQRAKKKLKAVLIWMRFIIERQQEAAERLVLKEATETSYVPKRASEPAVDVSLGESIRQNVLRHSSKACEHHTQQIRVCGTIRRTPLLKNLRRENSFSARESPRVEIPKRIISMQPAMLSGSVFDSSMTISDNGGGHVQDNAESPATDAELYLASISSNTSR